MCLCTRHLSWPCLYLVIYSVLLIFAEYLTCLLILVKYDCIRRKQVSSRVLFYTLLDYLSLHLKLKTILIIYSAFQYYQCVY